MPEYSRSDTRTDWQAQAGAHAPGPGERPSGWAGWLVFAGVMLAVVGLFQAMTGLTAILDDGFFVVRSDSLIISVDYAYWGWAHLLLGVVAIVAAALLLRGNVVGRVLAGIIAAVSILLHLAFLPAYPWWSVLAIAFNVIVLYAITMHGAELHSRR
jgi:hypothetical protein